MTDMISPRDWTVLLVIALKRTPTLRDVDRHVLITPGTAEPHLRVLERLGLVQVSGGMCQPTVEGLAILGDIDDLRHTLEEDLHAVA